MTADPVRLQQVCWNLLSNAVKFTPSGGRIDLRLDHTRDGVRIVVKDSGEGIRREFLPHVFDPFRQAEPTRRRRHSGLGLGLAIVRRVVELHGGRAEARSDGEGRGAEFIVTLPLVPHTIGAGQMPASDVLKAAVPGSRNTGR